MERNTRRPPGTILECIGDVESYADCGKLLFAKGKQYVIQPDFSIIDETGHSRLYVHSELFKRKAFKVIKTRYFLVTYMPYKQDTILLRIILLLLTCVIGGGLFYTMYDIKSIIGIIASLIAILCTVFYILFNDFEYE